MEKNNNRGKSRLGKIALNGNGNNIKTVHDINSVFFSNNLLDFYFSKFETSINILRSYASI